MLLTLKMTFLWKRLQRALKEILVPTGNLKIINYIIQAVIVIVK